MFSGTVDLQLVIASIPLAVSFALAFGLFALRFPDAAVGALALHVVSLDHFIGPGGIRFSVVLGLALAAVMFATVALRRVVPARNLILVGAAFAAVMVLTFVAHRAQPFNIGDIHLRRHLLSALLPLIFVGTIATRTNALRRHVLTLLLVGTIGHVAYLAIVMWKIGDGRVGWNLLNYNIGSAAAASVLLLLIAVAISHTIRSRFHRAAWTTLVVVPALLVILLSGTRIVLVAAAMGGTLLVALGPARGIQTLARGVVVMAAVLVVASVVAPSTVWLVMTSLAERFLALLDMSYGELGGARSALLQAGWEQFRSSPLVGVGTGNGGMLVTPWEGADSYRLHIHNDFMWILAEQGLIGFSLVMILLLGAFRRAWWAATRGPRGGVGRALGVGTLAALAASLVLTTTGSSPLLFWTAAVAWCAAPVAAAERGAHAAEAAQAAATARPPPHAATRYGGA